MHENDIITVNIEKFSNLGYGIAKVDGYIIFVEGACPGDIISAKITKANKNFANAKTLEVIKPSPHRVEPFCAMQKVCGACQLQFIDYDYQLELKREIVKDAIRSIAGLEIEIPKPISSPETKNYRHKIQYPISETKVSKRILAGYYKPQTHEIVNIKHCPIQPEICDQIIDFIREQAIDFGITGFNEKKHSGDLRHVVIRSSVKNGKQLVTLVVNATKTFDRLNNFAKAIHDKFKEVVGVCVNFNSKKTITSWIRASGLSTLLTATITLWPSSSALPRTKRVWGIGPSAASTSRITPLTIFRIRSTSPPKSAWPGVSTILIL